MIAKCISSNVKTWKKKKDLAILLQWFLNARFCLSEVCASSSHRAQGIGLLKFIHLREVAAKNTIRSRRGLCGSNGCGSGFGCRCRASARFKMSFTSFLAPPSKGPSMELEGHLDEEKLLLPLLSQPMTLHLAFASQSSFLLPSSQNRSRKCTAQKPALC